MPAEPPPGRVPHAAKRTALAYAAWADELLDRLHRLRNDTTDRQLRGMLVDLSDHTARAWMAARTLARVLDEVEEYIADRDPQP
jgi:hypothetical protein